MKSHPLLLGLVLLIALLPLYYINRFLQRSIRPRDSAGRFFLFMMANFLLIVVYTILVVGLMGEMFIK